MWKGKCPFQFRETSEIPLMNGEFTARDLRFCTQLSDILFHVIDGRNERSFEEKKRFHLVQRQKSSVANSNTLQISSQQKKKNEQRLWFIEVECT